MNEKKWKIVYEDSACYVEFYLDEVFSGNAYPVLLIDGVERDAELMKDQVTLRVSISLADIDNIKEVMTPALLWASLRTEETKRKKPSQKTVLDQSDFPTAPDPVCSGKFEVVCHDYDYGDDALALPGASANVEFRARVYMPKDATGAHPVVVFLHGRHSICFSEGGYGATSWPCSGDCKPTPSHEGYGVAGSALASHGYVVISVSANGISPIESEFLIAQGGTLRGNLILAHLDLLAEANNGNRPELSYLIGKLDLNNVGLLGHSRGGEGIARAITLNRFLKKGYGIRAALFLGSTSREGIAIPDTYTATVLPFLDGDVLDLTGQGFADLSRYAFDDDVLHSSVLLLGANHNYFNDVWSPGFPGGMDDAANTWGELQVSRLAQDEQRVLGCFYIAGFFRLALGGEQEYLTLFDGSPISVPKLPGAEVRSSAQFPSSGRYTLQRFETLYCDDASLPSVGWSWNIKEGIGEIKNKASFNNSLRHGHGLRYAHNLYHSFLNLKSQPDGASALLELRLPDGSNPVDLSLYTHLSFHVFYLRSENPSEAVELHVTLGSVTLSLTEGASTLWQVPEIIPGVETVLQQQVCIPLTNFTVDLKKPLTTVLVALPKGGNIYLSDIAFVKPSLGTIKNMTLPFISVEDVHIVPTGMEQVLEINVTLSEPSLLDVSMRVYTLVVHAVLGILRLDTSIVFKPGEQLKTAVFIIPAGGFRSESSGPDAVDYFSVIEARGLSNALFDRDRSYLTTPRNAS